jgi:hypothetical protein
MINYHETPASRAAKNAEANEIIERHGAEAELSRVKSQLKLAGNLMRAPETLREEIARCALYALVSDT